MSLWSADPQSVEQLRSIFKSTLSSSSSERTAANDALAQARQLPDFDNYLVTLLVFSTASSDVRAAAGINLKNLINKKPLTVRPYVMAVIFEGLQLPDTMVRNITGNVITALFAAHGSTAWPPALPTLLAAAETGTVETREAAVGALAKICEDSALLLELDGPGGENPDLELLQPRILAIAASGPSPKLRALAVGALNYLIPLKATLDAFFESYLHTLFTLANDSAADVRKNVCAAFVLIVETRPNTLAPHMAGVVEYCIHVMQDVDDEVAMEACEFLLALSEAPADARAPFRPQLAAVLPVLLEKMQYLEEQIFIMQALDAKDAGQADRQEDIKRHTAKGKSHGRVADSDSDDDSDDDDDELDSWNLRRCAAATLDALSLVYPADVLSVALPILQEKIVSTEWPTREAAILAFGAVSASCVDLAADKVPTLIPFLVQRLQDDEPRVRQITCWTVSRYAGWVCGEAYGGECANYFAPTFEAVVQCALDGKKIVQEAACSALASFVEAADVSLLEGYVVPLLDHFSQCLRLYQRKNMITLYDCVLTYVDKIGQELFAPNAGNLLPPLLENWQLLDDEDPALWPLLECMLVVAATMGELFAPYAVAVYERAVSILGNAVQLNRDVHTDPEIEAPEKDFIVTSLDLVDGLVQGFKGHAADLMARAPVMPLVVLCLEDHDDDVRQLAYALLGDLAIFSVATVRPSLDHVIVCIGNEINNCSYSSYPVTNNAIWAFGELALTAQPAELAPYLANIVSLLVPVLTATDTQQTVLENAAICLGRLGLAGGTEHVAPRLADIIYPWCAQIMYMPENEEKETAFLGMLHLVQSNPDHGFGGLANQQGRKNLAVFVSCIGNYSAPSQKLRETFLHFLQGYQGLLGASWGEVVALIDAETRASLQAYGI